MQLQLDGRREGREPPAVCFELSPTSEHSTGIRQADQLQRSTSLLKCTLEGKAASPPLRQCANASAAAEIGDISSCAVGADLQFPCAEANANAVLSLHPVEISLSASAYIASASASPSILSALFLFLSLSPPVQL